MRVTLEAQLWAAKLSQRVGRRRRAYSLLDRQLAAHPEYEPAWRALAGLLNGADAQLAYWIGLRAQAAGRCEIVVGALHRLLACNGESRWLIELFPPADWPLSRSEQYWQLVATKLTPPQLADVAMRAQKLGHGPEAARLLRQAMITSPRDLVVRQSLVVLLENQYRLTEAEQFAAELVRMAPADVDANLALARIQFGLARFKGAAETLELLLAYYPNDPRVLLEYGRVVRYSYERVGTEERVFERAGDLADGDGFVLEMVAQYFWFQLDFAKAAKYYGHLLEKNPGAWANPVTCRNYAECLNKTGRGAEAAATIAKALKHCRDATRNSSGEARELLIREQARLLNESDEAEEATRTLRSIKGIAIENNYVREEYLPHTTTRLARLRRMVEGRDLLLLLQGPSFADFATHASEIRGHDFVTATLSSFPPIEDTLLKTTGRHADIVLLSHPSSLRTWRNEVSRFLTRPAPTLLLTTRYALSSLADLGESEQDFIRLHDERLLYIHPVDGPPLPSRPLHFETGGSLALLLPLLLLGRPARVFLFGADGGANPSAPKRPYFYYDDIDSDGPAEDFTKRPDMISFRSEPNWLREANRRFRIDAINNDRVMTFALQCLEAIFDIPLPPILNVCPHSTHAIFPTIDCPTAITMLRGGAERGSVCQSDVVGGTCAISSSSAEGGTPGW
jgi:tetratricopeptide (TPR) repeat protein